MYIVLMTIYLYLFLDPICLFEFLCLTLIGSTLLVSHSGLLALLSLKCWLTLGRVLTRLVLKPKVLSSLGYEPRGALTAYPLNQTCL
jgi:hypothetical protein